MSDQQALPPTTDAEAKVAWRDAYMTSLPPNLRPNVGDYRAQAAMRQAYEHGWAAAQVAALVAGCNYSRALNPPLMAIIQLERIGSYPPGRNPTAPPRTCPVCPPWANCDDPAVVIPPEWTLERLALIRQLRGIPTSELDEDAREQLMADLIRTQKES